MLSAGRTSTMGKQWGILARDCSQGFVTVPGLLGDLGKDSRNWGFAASKGDNSITGCQYILSVRWEEWSQASGFVGKEQQPLIILGRGKNGISMASRVFLFLSELQQECKESACRCRSLGFDPGSERSPGGGNGNPLQYSCLENSMDRGAWCGIVHGVANSQTWQHLSTYPDKSAERPLVWCWYPERWCSAHSSLAVRRAWPVPATPGPSCDSSRCQGTCLSLFRVFSTWYICWCILMKQVVSL